MSPIEIFVDGKTHAISATGASTINLPNPPGGEVSWFGDDASSGIVVTGKESEGEFFELKEVGEIASYETVEDLSDNLFPFAANSKNIKITIRRK